MLREHTPFSMDFNAANLMEQTALNLAAGSAEIRRILVRPLIVGKIMEFGLSRIATLRWLFLQPHDIVPMSEEQRNAFLVVATLVATATFQAALSPPGGLHLIDVIGTNHTLTHLASNSSTTEGKSIMPKGYFILFSTINTCAFIASAATILFILPKKFPFGMLYMSIWLLVADYVISMNFITPF